MILFTADAEAALADGLNEAAKEAEKVKDKFIDFQISDFIPGLIEFGIKIAVIALIWFVGKKLTALVLRLFDKTAEYHHFDISVTKFLAILIRWGMYLVIICTILNYLDIGTASLVAVLGSAGLAVGMSLQGSLSNFAGSVILLVMKPFQVGDYIVTSIGEGTVKIIGLIYTTLVTIDGKEVHIPNGTLANSNITNVSASPTRTVSVKVGVSYQSDIKKAKVLIEKMMRDCEYVLPDSDFKVFVASLGESSISMEGRCTVATEDFWTTSWYFNEKIKEIFDEEGIEIPYSQLDVHLKQ